MVMRSHALTRAHVLRAFTRAALGKHNSHSLRSIADTRGNGRGSSCSPAQRHAVRSRCVDDARLSESAKPMTGANLVWETTNTLMHALFTDDEARVAKCFAAIFASSVISPQQDEGIMADGSFHQHGPELLAGS